MATALHRPPELGGRIQVDKPLRHREAEDRGDALAHPAGRLRAAAPLDPLERGEDLGRIDPVDRPLAQFGQDIALEAGEDIPITVLDLPEELDQEIAGIKLETMGLQIDSLTEEQIVYATDYSAGT